ncbi:MAG TPA: 1-acyl-sn-glycerol-3-phosphate acyltransferase [Sedimenticola sp.]|nr:1-acyl-sn-glycerol-3-phosphate acyltransferase [Sedimenticola sp.]
MGYGIVDPVVCTREPARRAPSIVIRSLARVAWMLLGWLELIILTLPLYLLSFLPPAPPGGWYTRLFQAWCRAFVHALGVDLRLHQKNRHPLPDHYLLIANHPSAFEDIGIPALFDVDCLAKAEVRDWWIVGRISAAAGTLFVERESKASRREAVRQITGRLASGRNVALYPEGGVKGKRLHDHFRYGVFEISLQTGVPILPVFIHYEAQDDFYWSDQLLLEKIIDIMATCNNRANYYLFDAFHPEDFSDKAQYSEAVHRSYLAWQRKYLE